LISLIQTAEGALNETHSILQRMRELAVQSSNDTNTETDRGEIQKEVNQLAEEITRIADNTEFNTQNLLGGEFEATFHIGANEGQNINVGINAMDATALEMVGVGTGDTLESLTQETDATVDGVTGSTVLKDGDTVVAVEVNGSYYNADDVQSNGEETAELETKEGAVALTGFVEGSSGEANWGITLNGGIDISSQTAADSAITTINDAIETVSAERSKLGAVQNRLDHTINNLGTSAENLTAAESRIRDVDMAKEMMEFTKNNILSQAAQSMLAQAQQSPQGVLQLLQ
jgi:flagellin